MIEIYIADKGEKVPLEEATGLLSNDSIEQGSHCAQTLMDMRDAASNLSEQLKKLDKTRIAEAEALLLINRQLREELERVKASLICQMETVKRCAEIIIYERKLNTDLRATLAAAKEALRRIATHFPIDDGEEMPSLARQQCKQARDALARIAECEKET